MTATIDRPLADQDVLSLPPPGEVPGPEAAAEDASPVALRPLVAVALGLAAAASMAGGIFGSWTARACGVAGVLLGVGWAWFVLRRERGRLVRQLLLVPMVLGVGTIAAIPGSDGRSPTALLSDAVNSGRVFRPPIPFDAGWRPLLIVVFAIVAFATAWMATALQRPKASLLVAVGVIGLTAITQAPDGQLVASLAAGLPFLASVAVLFAGDTGGMALSAAFERKRLLRSALMVIPGVVVLVLASNSSILFPKPVYDPADQPQKPRSVPLSETRDRVLFEVDGPITGPWIIGALDVYDGESWRLAPQDPKRLKKLPSSGVVDPRPWQTPSITVKFTTRDLGDTATFPTAAMVARASFPPGGAPFFDVRTQTFRVKSGRVPANVTYTLTLPAYPAATDLQAASRAVPNDIEEFLEIPAPPKSVRALLKAAPDNPWLRLDYLRSELNKVVIASGAGVPGPMKPTKVEQLFSGNHEGTPFEIVAAEAMLARWAGVPSRIGFGFDGGQIENSIVTIRPKNAAQFLEVWFSGYGWVPVVGAPPKAKNQLNNDDDVKVDPTIVASDDIAVDLYIPIELQNYAQLYERVRSYLLRYVAPAAAALVMVYLGLPWVQRARRGARRRRWAEVRSPREIVGVEYAHFRDLATDLGVGDPYDTPLEYLQRIADDDEHRQFAWLVTRVLYGDLESTAAETEIRAARELGESLRRRLFRAQPLQTRVLAVLSRASLIDPYSREMPNVELLKLPRLRLPRVRVLRMPRIGLARR